MNFFNKKSSGRTQDDAAQGQERDYRFNDVSGMSDADTFNFGKNAADSLTPKPGEQRLPVHPASRPTAPPLRLHNAVPEEATPEPEDTLDIDDDENAFAEPAKPAKPAPLRLGGDAVRKPEPPRQTGAADRLASLREQLIRDAAEDNSDDDAFEDDEPEEMAAQTAPQATPVKPVSARKPEPREIPYTAPKDGEAPQGPSIRKRGSTRILTPSQTASVLGTQPEPAARPAPEVPRTPSIRRAVAPSEPVAVEPAPAPEPPQPPVEQPAPVAAPAAAAPEPQIAMPDPTTGRAARRAGRVKTRLLGFDANAAAATPNPFEKEAVDGGAPDMMFPVGWLVVLKGPGRGASFTLGNGVSQIGRGEDQAVALDFGDTSISRTNHAAIAYDGEQRKHFLGQSGKANLVRLNDRPVLSTEELTNGDRIRIGETTLQFIALCGEDFDWGGDDEDDI